MSRSLNRAGWTLAVLLIEALCLSETASAADYSVLHVFLKRGSDGKIPEGDLLLDKSGNPYGTTANGGASGRDRRSLRPKGIPATNGPKRRVRKPKPATNRPPKAGGTYDRAELRLAHRPSFSLGSAPRANDCARSTLYFANVFCTEER